MNYKNQLLFLIFYISFLIPNQTNAFGYEFTNSIESQNFLAEASTVAEPNKSGGQVKVKIPNTNLPPVEYVAITKNEKITKPEQCLDGSGKQAFASNEEPFKIKWASKTQCVQGLVDATLSANKIDDIKSSIAVIDRFINSIKQTIEETKEMTSLQGVSFVILPSGEKVNKTYEKASGISLQCVSGSEAPLGSLTGVAGNNFTNPTSKLITQTKAEKNKIEKSYQDFIKESDSSRGKVTHSTLSRLVNLKNTLSSNFVIITDASFGKYHQYLSNTENFIPLSVAIETGEDNKKRQCGTSGFGVSTKISLGGVKGAFVKSIVNLDGKSFAPECIPEEYLLAELKTGMAKSLTTFEKMKSEYEAMLAKEEGALTAITNAKYYCENTAIQSEVKNTNAKDGSKENSDGKIKKSSISSKSSTNNTNNSNSEAIHVQAKLIALKSEVKSNEIVQVKAISPANTTKTSIYISCPTGVSSLTSGFECNKLISLGKYFNGLNASFVNRASESQNISIRFYASVSGREGSIESFPLTITILPGTAVHTSIPKPVPVYSSTPTHTTIPTYQASYTTTPLHSSSTSPSQSISPSHTPVTTPSSVSSPIYTPSSNTTNTPSPSYTPSTIPSATASPSYTPSSSPTTMQQKVGEQKASIFEVFGKWLFSL